MAFDFTNYKRLDYLESSGTQYIDTGFIPAANTTAEISFKKANGWANSNNIGGVRNRSNDTTRFGFISSGNGNGGYFSGNAVSTNYVISNNWNKWKVSATEFWIDDVLENTFVSTVTPSGLPFTIFAFNNDGGALQYQNCQIKSFKLWLGTTLKRDLVPAQRKRDNTLGMYDASNSTKNLFEFPSTSLNVGGIPTTERDLSIDTWYGAFAFNGFASIDSMTVSSMTKSAVTFTSTSSNYGLTKFIQLDPLKQYTVSAVVGSGQRNHCAVMAFKKLLNGKYAFEKTIKSGVGIPTSFSTLSDPDMIYGIIFYGNANSEQTYSKIQIEEGSVATEYEPYPFYINAGTGTFIAGPDDYYVPRINNKRFKTQNVPSDYLQLQYIQSDGNAYINTGVVPTLTTGFKIKMSAQNLSSSMNKTLFGSSADSNIKSIGGFTVDMWSGGFYFGFGKLDTATHKLIVPNINNEIYSISMNYKNDGYFRRDSNSVAIPAYSGEFNTNPICIIGRCTNTGFSYGHPMRLYEAELTSGTNVTHKFVPVKRISDGSIGMYNLCSTGKNIFNIYSSKINGYVNSDTGVLTSASNQQVSLLLRVKPNTTYTISGSTSTVGLFESNPSIGSSASHFYTSETRTFTTGANETYLVTLLTWSSGDWRYIAQIEEGSVATEYEPYPFYMNSGSTLFTAGPESRVYFNSTQTYISDIPEAYTRLEWLKSTRNAYIDLGFIPNQTTMAKCSFIYHPASSYYGVVFGSRIAHAIRQFNAWDKSDNANDGIRIDYAMGNNIYGADMGQTPSGSLIDGNSYSYELGHAYFKCPELSITNYQFPQDSTYQNDFECPGNLFLFCKAQYSEVGSAAVAEWFTNSCIKSFYAEHDGVNIRDMVPAKRKSDGVLGMYDKANSGKNLWDNSMPYTNGYLKADGTIDTVVSKPYYCIDYIDIKPSKGYTYSVTLTTAGAGDGIRICFYDENKNFVGERAGGESSSAQHYRYRITSPSNARYIRISQVATFKNAQLEEGSNETAYEVHPFYTSANSSGSFIAGPPRAVKQFNTFYKF